MAGSGPGRVVRLALASAALAVPAAAPASAQQIRAAVLGDSIRVGDVVPVALRTTVPAGQRVLWPDTLPLGGPEGDLENAARVRVREDTLSDGRIQVTGLYSITPWRTGEVTLPDVEVPVVAGNEVARTLTVGLPPFQVASVLPSDTAGIQPRPAKDVLGRNWAWWPFLLALLLLLALAALAWWIIRRKRLRGAILAPAAAVPPREAALAALDRAREAGLAERGEMKEFYTRIAAAVRAYLAAVEPGWGEDRTTTELLSVVRTQAGSGTATDLAAILRSADQVKFARRDPSPGEAMGDWERTRSWVEAFRWNEPTPDVEEAA